MLFRSRLGAMNERLWTFEEVQPGQRGADTVVTITAADIAEYALVSQNPDERYRGPSVAMPTMILNYAPLMRELIANENGFVAYEQSETARRQTPFTKCEIRWHAPVAADDIIAGSRYVLEKYRRRGSNFVTFRVEATNQRAIRVGEYDYTCIFDYARGHRDDSKSRRKLPGEVDAASGSRLFADFESIAVGDRLPGIMILETQETMNAKDAFRLVGERGVGSNMHTDEAFARYGIFGSTVNSGPATMAYVDQRLERSFPPSALYRDGRLSMRAITPWHAGDTVSFHGEVTGKSNGAAVECRIRGTNQSGDLVCIADAVLHCA